jgi:hypothetical protein
MAIIFPSGYREIRDSLAYFYAKTGRDTITNRELHSCLGMYNFSKNKINEIIEDECGTLLYPVGQGVYKFDASSMDSGLSSSIRVQVQTEIRKLMSNIKLLSSNISALQNERSYMYLKQVYEDLERILNAR